MKNKMNAVSVHLALLPARCFVRNTYKCFVTILKNP